MPDFDTIVIGSGAGGLAAAVALSNAGQRVLVLEQHDLPGGWCHSFWLDGFRFSPGVHYVGGLREGGGLRAVLEGLGVGGDIAFYEMNPDGYDHVVVAGERFDIPAGRDRFEERLTDRFPREAANIRRLFARMLAVDREMGRLQSLRGPASLLGLPFKAPNALRFGWRSAASIIRGSVTDPFLRAILEVRAGDHGMCPTRVPFAQHVAVEAHYWDGAWYPKGGGAAFPRALLKRLRANGGELRVRTRVRRVVLDARRAVGVELENGDVVRADRVISNADAWTTYGQLVGDEHLSERLRRRVKRLEPSLSALSLFLGVEMDVRAAGIDSGNFWVLPNADVSGAYRFAERGDLHGDGELPALFVTSPTVKDPRPNAGDRHSIEAFTFVPYDPFSGWAGSETGARDAEYASFKAALTERMLSAVERVVPGVRECATLCELGTPLTNAHYVNAHRGNLYGTAKTLTQLGPFAMPLVTEIDGLYHCGASTIAHGVLGALFSGLVTAGRVLKTPWRALLDEGRGGEVALRNA